jgi:PAS domain-containing protein
MKRSDETLLMVAPAWRDPRIHLLDDIWLLAIFAILVACALPWLISTFPIDLVPAALGLLALGALHVAFSIASAPGRPRTSLHTRALSALHALGIICIGYVWEHSGGLQNPMFLAVFVLPVIGAVFISRWQPYLMALLSIVVVAVFSLAHTPELRWYATGIQGIGPWIAQLFSNDPGRLVSPFPGFYAPSGYYLVMLEVFAILVIACAIAAEHLGTVFERMYAHAATARAEAQRGEELWTTLIEQLPVPAVLVDADTSQVICASSQVAPSFCALDTEVAGRDLFNVIRFSYPEVVQELVSGFGGIAPLAMIRVGEQIRVTDVRVQHVAQRGRRFALVLIIDTTEEFIRRAALEASDSAALIVDPHGRILGFNRQATTLFPTAEVGGDAGAALAAAGLPGNWWQPQLTGKRRMLMQIPPRVFQVTISPVVLPGEEEKIQVIAFLPVGRAGDADTTSITRATFVGASPVQP